MGRWCIIFLSVFFGQWAAAQETLSPQHDVILILDASTSMQDEIEGDVKMDMVKAATIGGISDLNDAASIGLMVYGHRKVGDCDDIETLVPLKHASAVDFTASINTLQPKGRTPLTEAVRQAAKSLKGRTANSSIVLITDGPETCGGDPCALGRELHASNTGVKTHIIGLDVTGRKSSALQCLAVETGGTYREADDRRELTTALSKVVDAIKKNAPPAPPTIGPPPVLTTRAPVPGQRD